MTQYKYISVFKSETDVPGSIDMGERHIRCGKKPDKHTQDFFGDDNDLYAVEWSLIGTMELPMRMDEDEIFDYIEGRGEEILEECQ